tara:strand:+ start:135 stop:701 length:567 start_codon:yes stop_codon:yes gene_type:complete
MSSTNIYFIVNILIQFIIFIITVSQKPKANSAPFYFSEIFKQSSVLYTILGSIFLIFLLKPDITSDGNKKIVIPLAIGIVAYIMSFLMTLKQFKECKKRKYWVAFYKSIFASMIILGTYFIIANMSWAQQGFMDLYNVTQDDESSNMISLYTSYLFWIMSASFISTSFIFFSNYESCESDTKIIIQKV